MSPSSETGQSNAESSKLGSTSLPAPHFVLAHSSVDSNSAPPSSPPQRISSDFAEQGFKSSSSSGAGSAKTDSLLEGLDDDDDELEEELIIGEDDDAEVGQLLVSRGRRRRRRRFEEDDGQVEKSVYELIPPLILAHPLPLFPLLAVLPYNFLPAGVVLFVPIICVLAVLSACAHIVIVYLAWYLKVSSFEAVFAAVTGRYGIYGLWAGRAAIVCSVVGMLVGWLNTLYPLLQPLLNSYGMSNSILSSRLLWTMIASTTLLPSLLPSRMTRSLRNAPWVLAVILPVVAFLVIGRTVEIAKAGQLLPIEGGEDDSVLSTLTDHRLQRRSDMGDDPSAMAGLATLVLFFSPYINTLPIHASLARAKHGSFPLACLITSAILLTLSLPLSLVPYYLLAKDEHAVGDRNTAGVFSQLPSDDGWLNLARVLMCAVTLGSCTMWILRGRDAILSSMGVDRGERQKAGKWVGLALWVVVVFFASIGSWFANKIEALGIVATLAIGWFLPSLFFIVTFHVRSPLSIIFPSHDRPTTPNDPSGIATNHVSRQTHRRTDSLNDPSTDALLARKEQQLQRRRLGRRLWQDLIVYVGILPIGMIALGWTLGNLLGFW